MKPIEEKKYSCSRQFSERVFGKNINYSNATSTINRNLQTFSSQYNRIRKKKIRKDGEKS